MGKMACAVTGRPEPERDSEAICATALCPLTKKRETDSCVIVN